VTPSRLFAIGFIFACTTVGWFVLGVSLAVRTGESDASLAAEVSKLWGGIHQQTAPLARIERTRRVTKTVTEKDAMGQPLVREVASDAIDVSDLPLASSRVNVDLNLDQRRKGLLWYDTYAVRFHGEYMVRNPDDVSRDVSLEFRFPSKEAPYDGFVFRVGGQEVAHPGDLSAGLAARCTLSPRAEVLVEVSYASRGLGDWTYAFAPSGVAQAKDFKLEMLTDFEAIDFPAGTISPTRSVRKGDGWQLEWVFSSMVTGQRIGMDMPNRLNPGPLASRITMFAPVSLLFFLTVMVIQGMVTGRNLHPMNYFFLSAAFFAFHLLMAYLVDHINIHAAFVIAAATSIALVVSYLRLVTGARDTLLSAAAAQATFLVLFSYAFFFEGYTGLAVTIGSIITLFVLMQLTARVDWGGQFSRIPARTD